MLTQNHFSPVITAALLLSLAAGAANEVSPVNASEAVAAQDARINDERGHWHRHGPQGKGWVHNGRNHQPAVVYEAIRLKIYGPPSTRPRGESGAMHLDWRHIRHTGVIYP